jgi:hypothetical protein
MPRRVFCYCGCSLDLLDLRKHRPMVIPDKTKMGNRCRVGISSTILRCQYEVKGKIRVPRRNKQPHTSVDSGTGQICPRSGTVHNNTFTRGYPVFGSLFRKPLPL